MDIPTRIWIRIEFIYLKFSMVKLKWKVISISVFLLLPIHIQHWICRPRLPFDVLSKLKYMVLNEPNANVQCSLFTVHWFPFNIQLIYFFSASYLWIHSRIQSNKINDSLSNFPMSIFDNDTNLRALVIIILRTDSSNP